MRQEKAISESTRCRECDAQVPCDQDGNPLSLVCTRHGGQYAVRTFRTETKFNYNLEKWNDRIRSKAVSPQAKNLREEIAVLRVMLELRLQSIDPNDQLAVMQAHTPIIDLVGKLERLVTSCHKLEEKMGLTLDKNAVVQLAQAVTECVSVALQQTSISEKEAQEFLERVSNGIAAAVDNISSDGSAGTPSTQPD